MEIIYVKSDFDFSAVGNQWCEKYLPSSKSVFLPAGNSPLTLYRHWENFRPAYLNNKTLVQIDEILTGPKQNSFGQFFEKELPSYCSQITSPMKAKSGAELAILGLGINGHLGFHEPDIKLDLFCEEIELSLETRNYLGLKEATRAISYGLSAFMNTKAVLLLVRGSNKRKIYSEIFRNSNLPAKHLLKHSNLTIIADAEFAN